MVRPLSESPTCPGHPRSSIFGSPSPTTPRPSVSSTAVSDPNSVVLRRRWVFYDLRSNQAGIAVSGEIILHSDHLYVQVSQLAMGHRSGVLFRNCKGRKDYVGGPNNFASLDLLNRPDELAHWIREVCHV